MLGIWDHDIGNHGGSYSRAGEALGSTGRRPQTQAIGLDDIWVRDPKMEKGVPWSFYSN